MGEHAHRDRGCRSVGACRSSFRLSFEHIDSVVLERRHVDVFAVGADGYGGGGAHWLRASTVESWVDQASLTTALLGQRRCRPRPVEYVDRPGGQRDGVDSGSVEGSRASTSSAPEPGAAAYTFLPSPVTARPSTEDMARAVAQSPAPSFEMQPLV